MVWSRGFFRLWIILTLVWIGAVGLIIEKDDFKGLWAPKVKLDVEYNGGVKDTLDGSRPPEFLRQQIITGVNEDAKILAKKGDAAGAKKEIEEATSSANELLKVIADAEAKRADRLHRALTLLLVPPVSLLAFGIAIAWIARGFRRTV